MGKSFFSQAVLGLELVPSVIESAEDGAGDHALLGRCVGGDLCMSHLRSVLDREDLYII